MFDKRRPWTYRAKQANLPRIGSGIRISQPTPDPGPDPGAPRPVVQNEPNLACRPGPRRRNVQNNQFPVGRDTPAFHYAIIPSFQPQACCAKRSQFAPHEHKSRRPAGLRQNKANSRTDGKGRERARLPVPPVGAIVRNKANLPRPAGRDAGCPGRKCRRRWDKTRKTKPILPRVKRRASTWRKKSYDKLDLRKASAKRSHFGSSGFSVLAGYGRPRGGGAPTGLEVRSNRMSPNPQFPHERQ
jgi:hypothetical protein